MTETVRKKLRVGEREVAYHLRFSERKRLRIVVKPDQTVHVTAPSGTDTESIDEALRRRLHWITRQLDHFEQFKPLPTPLRYVSGETLLYLGRQYRLNISPGPPGIAKLKGRFLRISVPDSSDAERVKAQVDSWYRIRAEDVFSRYLSLCMTIGARHGIPEPRLRIQDMRTRWGSCSNRGWITLNLKLVQVPVHCLEYVVMHELCHLVHHSHSQEFYQLLAQCMPDWKQRRSVLKRYTFSNGS